MNLPAFLDVTRAFQFFIWQMISFWLIYNQDNERFQILGWKPRQLFGWNWWLWNECIMFHSVSPNLHITAYQWHGDWGLPQEHEQFGTNIPSGFLLRPHHQSIRKWLLSFCYFPSSIFFIEHLHRQHHHNNDDESNGCKDDDVYDADDDDRDNKTVIRMV